MSIITNTNTTVTTTTTSSSSNNNNQAQRKQQRNVVKSEAQQQKNEKVTTTEVKLNMKEIAINFICSWLSTPLFLLNHNIWVTSETSTIQPSWYYLPLFMIIFDLIYYSKHRFVDHTMVVKKLLGKWNVFLKTKHYIHHKPCISFVQTFDGDAFGFFLVGVGMYLVSYIMLPIPFLAKVTFLLFITALNCFIHEGEALENVQWQIFVSPKDHSLHHTYHRCNYASIFKLWDQVFGTYKSE